jgi:hypothetical protein
MGTMQMVIGKTPGIEESQNPIKIFTLITIDHDNNRED